MSSARSRRRSSSSTRSSSRTIEPSDGDGEILGEWLLAAELGGPGERLLGAGASGWRRSR
eukprot:864558-Pleurochrysis_carterae.AAC.1